MNNNHSNIWQAIVLRSSLGGNGEWRGSHHLISGQKEHLNCANEVFQYTTACFLH